MRWGGPTQQCWMLGCSRPCVLLALEFSDGVGAGVPGCACCTPGCLEWNGCVMLRCARDVELWGPGLSWPGQAGAEIQGICLSFLGM